MAERGLFIILEGPDHSGKTTQSLLLKEDLERKGLAAVQSREPGGTEVGEELRALLKKDRSKLMHPLTQMLGFYAARNEYITEFVQPNLDQGITVLSDRFNVSTYVYQGYAQGMDMEIIESLDRIVVGKRCRPDLCVILDVPAEETIRRIVHDGDGEGDIFDRQDLSFMEKIRAGYRQFAEVHNGDVILINGMQSRETIHEQVVRLVEEIRRERLYARRKI